MRVDTYIKLHGIFDRKVNIRDMGIVSSIFVNGDKVSPSHKIYPGDIITLELGRYKYYINVISYEEYKLEKELIDHHI